MLQDILFGLSLLASMTLFLQVIDARATNYELNQKIERLAEIHARAHQDNPSLPETCKHLYNNGQSEAWFDCMGVGRK